MIPLGRNARKHGIGGASWFSHGFQTPVHALWKIALSVPRAKTSSRLAPHDDASGPDVMTPPSESQPVHPGAHALCQSALSGPRAKTSMRLDPQETADGSLVICPPGGAPSESQLPCHVEPFQDWCQSLLSLPSATRSMRLPPQADASGADVRLPPRLCQVPHPLFHQLCQMALSAPLTK